MASAAAIVCFMLYLHPVTCQDMKGMGLRLESRCEARMDRMESQIGELRERMTHLEGLLGGLH